MNESKMAGKHLQPGDESRELAALYALDALPADEKAAFEQHLHQGCTVCVAEVASLRPVTEKLAMAPQPVRPPQELRGRLLERAASLQPHAVPARPGVLFEQGGLLISRSAEMAWQPGGVAGLSSKLLFVDQERGYNTLLVRMEPGTRYPSHHHVGVEELYLLDGDLIVEGQTMRAGDYCRAEPDSIHGESRTETGCLFVLRASQHDELVV
ncbi:MAG: cupin domain-containing protein [Acidobacteria bacterium]|nr:cupin domain-containing protein [Acidobacteriota bacterium]